MRWAYLNIESCHWDEGQRALYCKAAFVGSTMDQQHSSDLITTIKRGHRVQRASFIIIGAFEANLDNRRQAIQEQCQM